jgi:integrase
LDQTEGFVYKRCKDLSFKPEVFISANVMVVLAFYRLKQKNNPLGLVIPSQSGDYLEPRNLLRKFKALMKKANVPEIPFHNLRHTDVTMLMRMGENPKVVSERLGHSRVGIKLDIYSHTNEEMQRKTADRFDDQFWT